MNRKIKSLRLFYRSKALDVISEARALQQLGDSAIHSLQAVEDAEKRVVKGPFLDQRGKVQAEAKRQLSAIAGYIRQLAGRCSSAADAKRIAEEFGVRSASGGTASILEAIEKKIAGRIGAFVRPYG
jgi:hypothetical protein